MQRGIDLSLHALSFDKKNVNLPPIVICLNEILKLLHQYCKTYFEYNICMWRLNKLPSLRATIPDKIKENFVYR